MIKVTIEVKGKQVDRLLELALEHDLTICGMIHAIVGEYLGESTEKPIRKIKSAKSAKLTKDKRRPRRRQWNNEQD